MIGKLISSVAGPRILIGAIITLVIALALTCFFLSQKIDESASLSASNKSLRQTVLDSEKALHTLERSYKSSQVIVSKLRIEKRKSSKILKQQKKDLRNVSKDNECIDLPIPDDVTFILFNSGRINKDNDNSATIGAD